MSRFVFGVPKSRFGAFLVGLAVGLVGIAILSLWLAFQNLNLSDSIRTTHVGLGTLDARIQAVNKFLRDRNWECPNQLGRGVEDLLFETRFESLGIVPGPPMAQARIAAKVTPRDVKAWLKGWKRYDGTAPVAGWIKLLAPMTLAHDLEQGGDVYVREEKLWTNFSLNDRPNLLVFPATGWILMTLRNCYVH